VQRSFVVRGELPCDSLFSVFVADECLDGRPGRRVVVRVPTSSEPGHNTWIPAARRLASVANPHVAGCAEVIRLRQGWALLDTHRAGVDLGRLQAAAPPDLVRMRVAVQIMAQTALGLHAAHGARPKGAQGTGVVHGDLCPQRIVVSALGVAAVQGFAFERRHQRADPRRAIWLPPEVLAGGAPTAASDVYTATKIGLGFLVGRWLDESPYHPRRHRSWREQVLRQLEDRLPPRPGTRSIVKLIAAALSNAPASRPPALELAQKLQAFACRLPGPDLGAYAGLLVPSLAARRTMRPAHGLLWESHRTAEASAPPQPEQHLHPAPTLADPTLIVRCALRYGPGKSESLASLVLRDFASLARVQLDALGALRLPTPLVVTVLTAVVFGWGAVADTAPMSGADVQHARAGQQRSAAPADAISVESALRGSLSESAGGHTAAGDRGLVSPDGVPRLVTATIGSK
jgi:hypothetical protein